jgi:hypothetical protein
MKTKLEDSLDAATRQARRSTWSLLLASLAVLLAAGYVHGIIVPAIDAEGIPTMTGLATLRLACLIAACFGLAIAIYSGILITGRLLAR